MDSDSRTLSVGVKSLMDDGPVILLTSVNSSWSSMIVDFIKQIMGDESALCSVTLGSVNSPKTSWLLEIDLWLSESIHCHLFGIPEVITWLSACNRCSFSVICHRKLFTSLLFVNLLTVYRNSGTTRRWDLLALCNSMQYSICYR